jgi:hypothetical protein
MVYEGRGPSRVKAPFESEASENVEEEDQDYVRIAGADTVDVMSDNSNLSEEKSEKSEVEFVLSEDATGPAPDFITSSADEVVEMDMVRYDESFDHSEGSMSEGFA